MKKIAFVVHRYGKEITGGAEYECMLMAKRLKQYYEVEILTTCAKDDATWANEYAEGIEDDAGVIVRRFLTDENRRLDRYNEIFNIVGGAHEYTEEIDWIISQGPYSYDLFRYIHLNYNQYDAIIFMTYLYYTSAVCMVGIPNAIFVPTAHDEKPIYLEHFNRVFDVPQAIMYNTDEEKELVERLFPETKDKPSIVGVLGFDIPVEGEEERDLVSVEGDYLLYAGRITPAKGCDTLIEYFLKYKKETETDLKLVLIGKLDMELPDDENIIFLGFVSEEQKTKLMREATAFVIASHFESLSMVVLEAMSVKTPVMVTSHCEVLKGHIDKSGAGVCFGTYNDFSEGIERVIQNREIFVVNGKSYVEKKYAWDVIINQIRGIIEGIQFQKSDEEICPVEQTTVVNAELKPAFEEKNISIVFATDNNYVPLLAVALNSLIENSSDENNYDIVVLSDNISRLHKEQILKLIEGRDNFSLRYIEVFNELNKLSFQFNNTQLSRATFMRLFVPRYFKNYHKIIYLDCDIVLQTDIANLYCQDISGYMVGAVRDVHVGEVSKSNSVFRDYVVNDLGLESAEDYFNAGVLMMNIDEVCKLYTSEDLFSLATSRKWNWEDQDVLNKISKGKVYYFPYNWNVFWVPNTSIQHLMEMNVNYSKALGNPFLIHYAAGAIPVKRIEDRFFECFWKYAKGTAYYELLIRWMILGYNHLPPMTAVVPPSPVAAPAQTLTFWQIVKGKAHAVVYYTKKDGFFKMLIRAKRKIFGK